LNQSGFSIYPEFYSMTYNKDLLILSIETSTRPGSVALLRGGELLAQKTGDEKSSHSAQLLSDIKELLHHRQINLKQIELLAAAVGPGSFTGLRIGLATAKALAKALKIPLAGVSTLEAASQSYGNIGTNSVILPAGRSEFFVQSFKTNESGEKRSVSDVEIYTIENLIEKAKQSEMECLIANEEILSQIKKVSQNKNVIFQPMPKALAVSVGLIALTAFSQENLHKYPAQPIYVRGADVGGIKNV
jgi:tRNA threonylcarbamoyladenosine biosynthesis protein TsaB